MTADDSGTAGGVERLREYLLLRCDQNEREGGKHVRLEIADVRRALATTSDPTARTGGEAMREAAAKVAEQDGQQSESDARLWAADHMLRTAENAFQQAKAGPRIAAAIRALPLPGEAS